MKKINISAITLLFLLGVTAFWACNNELSPTQADNPPSAGVSSKDKIAVSTMVEISVDALVYKNFINSEVYEVMKSNIKDLTPVKIQSVSFFNSNLKGLVVSLRDINGLHRDLMIAYKADDYTKLMAFVRENNVETSIVKGKQIYNGIVNWYSADYSPLNQMTIERGKITKFKLNTVSNFNNGKVSGCQWNCTAKEFNDNYQESKNECESDALCDFACSFNPCAVAYAAAAVEACVTCQF